MLSVGLTSEGDSAESADVIGKTKGAEVKQEILAELTKPTRQISCNKNVHLFIYVYRIIFKNVKYGWLFH